MTKEEEKRPVWTCSDCGRRGRTGWKMIRYETLDAATEYELECPDCGSMDVEEQKENPPLPPAAP